MTDGTTMNGYSIETSIEDYLHWLEARGYIGVTLRARRRALALFARDVEALGIRSIESVSSRTIEQYQIALTARTPCAASVRYLHLRTVRQLFQFLADIRGLKANPCKALALPKQLRALPRLVLSRKQVRRILATPDRRTAKGIRNAAILELFYSTGIRLEEMTHLALDDLDFSAGLLRIEHAKFARSRVVPLGTKAADCLREYLAVARSERVTVGHEESALWLSVPRPHHPLGRRAIYSIVRAIGKAAGVRRPVSPHVWRHTCASHLVSRGAPISHVQRLLGHCSLNTTQIYTRTTIPELRKTFQRTHPRALERSVYVPDPSVS